MKASRGPGQRAGLTRQRVVAEAHALLAERGAEGLSMRALAERLGVRPNALYSHVATKTELIDAVLDEVLGDVDVPQAGSADPAAALRSLMTSTYDVLLRHPSLVPLYVARQGARGPNAQHLGDVMLDRMARAGVTGEHATEALHVLVIHTIGFAAFAARPPIAAAEAPELPADQLRATFDRGLRWVLAGIGV